MFGNKWQCEKPYKVVFVDGEMPATTLQERLSTIVASSEKELEDADNLKIITPDSLAARAPVRKNHSQPLASQYWHAAFEFPYREPCRRIYENPRIAQPHDPKAGVSNGEFEQEIFILEASSPMVISLLKTSRVIFNCNDVLIFFFISSSFRPKDLFL